MLFFVDDHKLTRLLSTKNFEGISYNIKESNILFNITLFYNSSMKLIFHDNFSLNLSVTIIVTMSKFAQAAY